MIKIQVILGSTRQNRFGDKPAKWIVDELKKNKEVDVELIDLRDVKLPFFDEPVSPLTSGGKYVLPEGAVWAKKIGEADGYIWVTPEYNHGYSSVLKNAIDYVYNEWNKKPVTFVAYGVLGGARAVEQLRQVAVELQMAPIRAAVHIPAYWTLLDENGNLKTETLQDSANIMIEQLIWWTKTLKEAREEK